MHARTMLMCTKAIGIRCGILPQRGVPELMTVLRGMVYNPAAQGKVLNDVARVLEGPPPAAGGQGAVVAPVAPENAAAPAQAAAGHVDQLPLAASGGNAAALPAGPAAAKPDDRTQSGAGAAKAKASPASTTKPKKP